MSKRSRLRLTAAIMLTALLAACAGSFAASVASGFGAAATSQWLAGALTTILVAIVIFRAVDENEDDD